MKSFGTPSEYERKEVDFFGRKFYVDERVHIPRKNTEPLLTLALEFIKKIKKVEKVNKPLVCADIGTGSGVIGINLCLEDQSVKKLYATDFYKRALEVARINVENYHLNKRVILLQGNVLEPLKEIKLDLIVANLPHASSEKHERKPYLSKVEPKEGTFSGESGLEFIEQFLSQLSEYKYLDNLLGVFLKVPTENYEKAVVLSKKYLSNFDVETSKDADGKMRYVSLIKKGV